MEDFKTKELPIGVTPKQLFHERRMIELVKAIDRYIEADKSEERCVKEWVIEYIEIADLLRLNDNLFINMFMLSNYKFLLIKRDLLEIVLSEMNEELNNNDLRNDMIQIKGIRK
jgi:hypothetical protein